jgi:hypothetical protein
MVRNWKKPVIMVAGSLIAMAAVVAIKKIKENIAAKKIGGESNTINEEEFEEDDVEDEDYSTATGNIMVDSIRTIIKDTNFDLDRIGIDLGIAENARTIHIAENQDEISFFLEFPEFGKSTPRIQDFIQACKDEAGKLWEIVKFSEEPFTSMEGWILVSYEKVGDCSNRKYFVSKLPESTLNRFRKDASESGNIVLTRCIEEVRNDLRKGNNVIDPDPDSDSDITNLRVEEIKLLYRISFRIQRESGLDSFGINPLGVKKCVEDLISNFSVAGRTSKYAWSQVLFYDTLAPEVSIWEPVSKEGGFSIESFSIDY